MASSSDNCFSSDDLSFEDVFVPTGPAFDSLSEHLTVKDAVRLGRSNTRLHAVVRDLMQKAISGRRTAHVALGDELVWQTRASDGAVRFRSFAPHDVARGFSLWGDPVVCEGPTGEMDSLNISLEGQAVVFPVEISLGLEWTICAWSFFRGGRPLRRGFVQPEGWIEGEHALVSSNGDDQHVFYSEGRGNWLGCYCEEPEESWNYQDQLDYDHFFSSHYSFRYGKISDGWHHIAAVGSNRRLGMAGDVPPEHGSGSTQYYVDGDLVGIAPFNLRAPVRVVGNASEDGGLNQPWGVVSDFRMYRRGLSPEHLRLVMVTPVRSAPTPADAGARESWRAPLTRLARELLRSLRL